MIANDSSAAPGPVSLSCVLFRAVSSVVSKQCGAGYLTAKKHLDVGMEAPGGGRTIYRRTTARGCCLGMLGTPQAQS